VNLFEEETENILSLLAKHKVKFILVGGLAVNYYGYSRTTGDVDLWLSDTPNNRICLISALKDIGMEGVEVLAESPLMAGFTEIMMDNGIYLDLMKDLQLLKQADFEDCYQTAKNFVLNNHTSVKVLHINALIDEKSGSSRPKDREDAEKLRIIREQQS
jgi:predicted nucleotidyltransferase